MIKILFIRSEKAFLPEIDVYIDYFNKIDNFTAYDSSKLKSYDINKFDVIWEFKGFRGIKKNKNQILIHEYASLSTGSFSKIKDYIKSKLNPKPDLRIFLNSNIKKGFKFNDDVSFCYRDMGIYRQDINTSYIKKEYDYIYIGSICKEREMDKFLEAFTLKNNGKLCLVGNVEDEIYDKYKSNKNLFFTGKVSYKEVPRFLSKAEYGINFIPDKYPYNFQTSTKLLDYLACGLKVITTDYKWVREFEKNNNCSFYKLNYNNLVFDKEDIEKYNFLNKFVVEEYLWENIIDKSGIKNKILELLKSSKENK